MSLLVVGHSSKSVDCHHLFNFGDCRSLVDCGRLSSSIRYRSLLITQCPPRILVASPIKARTIRSVIKTPSFKLLSRDQRIAVLILMVLRPLRQKFRSRTIWLLRRSMYPSFSRFYSFIDALGFAVMHQGGAKLAFINPPYGGRRNTILGQEKMVVRFRLKSSFVC